MTGDSPTPWLVLGAALAALLVVVLLVVLAAARRQRRATAALGAELAAAQVAAREEVERLRAEVEAVRRDATAPGGLVPHGDASRDAARGATSSYVITRLGDTDPDLEGGPLAGRRVEVAGRIDGRLFADLVVRETLVRVGSVAHGLRQALDPATRNRIRFEVRREVKRSRKARKADLKQARRDLHARQRAAQGIGEGIGEGAA